MYPTLQCNCLHDLPLHDWHVSSSRGQQARIVKQEADVGHMTAVSLVNMLLSLQQTLTTRFKEWWIAMCACFIQGYECEMTVLGFFLIPLVDNMDTGRDWLSRSRQHWPGSSCCWSGRHCSHPCHQLPLAKLLESSKFHKVILCF